MSITFSGTVQPNLGWIDFERTCANLSYWRVKRPRAVFTSHDLAVWPGPLNFLVTRPKGQIPLEVQSSSTQTTSLTSHFDSGLFHFLQAFKVDKYSRTSPFNIASSRFLICVQVFFFKEGFSLNTQTSMLGKARSIR